MKNLEASSPASPAVVVGREDDATTRDRVIQSILEHGPSTAAEMAARMSLTPAAIRRHLTALVDRGDLDSREQRVYGQRGRGRPSKVFFLTEEGRRDFYQAYDDLAVSAMTHLIDKAGPSALGVMAQEWVASIEQRFDQLQAQQPERSAVDTLTEALTAEGYVASVRPAMAGEQICQQHCPVSHVAAVFPQLCEAETQLFSRLLGTHVQRLATIAHGDGVCTTHVPTTVRPGDDPLPTRMSKTPTERSTS